MQINNKYIFCIRNIDSYNIIMNMLYYYNLNDNTPYLLYGDNILTIFI